MFSKFRDFPRTVRDTYYIHSKNVFNANIKHLIALTDTAVSRKFCVNIATKEMLDLRAVLLKFRPYYLP